MQLKSKGPTLWAHLQLLIKYTPDQFDRFRRQNMSKGMDAYADESWLLAYFDKLQPNERHTYHYLSSPQFSSYPISWRIRTSYNSTPNKKAQPLAISRLLVFFLVTRLILFVGFAIE